MGHGVFGQLPDDTGKIDGGIGPGGVENVTAYHGHDHIVTGRGIDQMGNHIVAGDEVGLGEVQ